MLIDKEITRKVELIERSPFAAGARSQVPTYAVVTNSTYDGLCYNVDRVVEELGKSVSRVHFDEAWYAYAKFHPIYRGRFAMDVPDSMPDRTPGATASAAIRSGSGASISPRRRRSWMSWTDRW